MPVAEHGTCFVNAVFGMKLAAVEKKPSTGRSENDCLACNLRNHGCPGLEALDNAGLPDSRLADKNDVVLPVLEEGLGDAQHFLLTTDHRSEFPLLCKPVQVAAKMSEGGPLFRFDLRFGLWLGFPSGFSNRVNNPAICISPFRSETFRQNTAFKSLRQRFPVCTDGRQASIKKRV